MFIWQLKLNMRYNIRKINYFYKIRKQKALCFEKITAKRQNHIK